MGATGGTHICARIILQLGSSHVPVTVTQAHSGMVFVMLSGRVISQTSKVEQEPEPDDHHNLQDFDFEQDSLNFLYGNLLSI